MNKRERARAIKQLEQQREKLEQSIENLNDVLERLYLEKAQAESPIKVGEIVECKGRLPGRSATRYLVTEIYSRHQQPRYMGRRFLSNGEVSKKVVDLKWKDPQPLKSKARRRAVKR